MILLVLAALTFGGCTVFSASDTVLVDNHLGNAQAMNKLVQADANAAPAYKQWMQADTASWQWMADKAHRRTPTTLPTK
jgi:hypothetical protein